MARESKRKRDEKRFGKPERLLDRIRIEGCGTFAGIQEIDEAYADLCYHREIASKFIDWATAMDVQEVCDWFWAAYEGTRFDIRKEIPQWRPPLSNLFIEFSHQGLRHGFLYLTSNPAEDGTSLLTIYHYIETRERKLVGPLSYSHVEVRESGELADLPTCFVIGGKLIPEKFSDMLFKLSETTSSVAAMAISFMHCKNVTTTVFEPNAQLNRERRKAGLKPFLRYHTINVEPMRSVLRAEGGVATNGLKKALHVCRGHFAHYATSFMGRALTEPITVWKPSHVRGSAKQGVVVSDYSVKAPAQSVTP